tara:strand:- start:1088 stop:2284 length:1197 start_codon:yes stop_codon:yes gene_type:complete
MSSNVPTLYLEINNSNYIFSVGQRDEYNNYKILHESVIPLAGIKDSRITESDDIYYLIKENIFVIEQKIKHSFKDIVLILDNFNPKFINVSGYKKLNGSQILRENITYILNKLKSYIDINEPKKTIIHIFNSKFNLDNKKIDNLPIGLFGDFYSQELSFILINTNDYRNLSNIIDKCKLKIKKILIKSYIDGVCSSEHNKNCETFYQVKFNENESKIFFFENNSLKSEQRFKFGADIIIRDISKVTSLDVNTIKIILKEIDLSHDISENELIDKKFFLNKNIRKIKKKLFYDIALARAYEIADLLIFNNTNFKNYKKYTKIIFFDLDEKSQLKGLDKIYQRTFSKDGDFKLNFIDGFPSKTFLNTADRLVHFGWKKEVIPISNSKKTLIRRIFESIFS